MGEVTKKIWGTTEQLVIEDGMHMHRIEFKAGGVCSEHLHSYRSNLFHVLRGILLVRVWERASRHETRLTEHVLRAGQSLAVPAGIKHQFEGIRDGEALEVYWINDEWVDGDDIVRFTQGYLR